MAGEIGVLNKKELIEKLNRIPGACAKKAMERTMKDMHRRGPSIIARHTADTFQIARGKLNPNTESGKGNSAVRSGGKSLASLSWTYKGQRLPITKGGSGFTLMGGKHQVKVKVHRGKTTLLGTATQGRRGPRNPHWGKSPWMKLKGLDHIALMRKGGSHKPGKGGWGSAATGPAVPSMVAAPKHRKYMLMELQDAMLARLKHNMDQALKHL